MRTEIRQATLCYSYNILNGGRQLHCQQKKVKITQVKSNWLYYSMNDVTYPRSLNISLHLIISDLARRRQSLKSKCSQIIINHGVCKEINTKHRPQFLLFRELSSLPKCKVREKTTPRQFVKNKERETLSDLG